MAFILLIFSFPFIAWWRAYVIIVLWGWFVPPYWYAPAPALHYVAGMLMMIELAWPARRSKSAEGIGKAIEVISHAALLTLFGLVFGWAWHTLGWGF